LFTTALKPSLSAVYSTTLLAPSGSIRLCDLPTLPLPSADSDSLLTSFVGSSFTTYSNAYVSSVSAAYGLADGDEHGGPDDRLDEYPDGAGSTTSAQTNTAANVCNATLL